MWFKEIIKLTDSTYAHLKIRSDLVYLSYWKRFAFSLFFFLGIVSNSSDHISPEILYRQWLHYDKDTSQALYKWSNHCFCSLNNIISYGEWSVTELNFWKTLLWWSGMVTVFWHCWFSGLVWLLIISSPRNSKQQPPQACLLEPLMWSQ